MLGDSDALVICQATVTAPVEEASDACVDLLEVLPKGGVPREDLQAGRACCVGLWNVQGDSLRRWRALGSLAWPWGHSRGLGERRAPTRPYGEP